jgi:hypothetical protein
MDKLKGTVCEQRKDKKTVVRQGESVKRRSKR